MWRRAFPAFLCITSLAAIIRADEPPKPPPSQVRLDSGRVVNYTFHFDRNSLQASERVGDSLIALTTSGALLRFELPGVRLVRERIGFDDVTCLGRGEGETVFAGLADARVCRIDPVTLELTDVLKLPAAPEWISWSGSREGRPAGLVVVTRPPKPVSREGRPLEMTHPMVHDLGTGKAYPLAESATTFLLDRKGRLWLGADHGEWGGVVARMDLAKGTTEKLEPPPSRDPKRKASWRGVYGFIELRDGQIWAFGGTSHFGINSGEITRVDITPPQTLFAVDPPKEIGNEPDHGRPFMPITHIIEEEKSLLVFSYSDVFRVDRALSSWKNVASLEIGYRWGRPDAVGAYPAVCAVHPPQRVGEPYLLATILDGYVSLDGQKATPRSLPGQLGASDVGEIEKTAEGILCFAFDLFEPERLSTWRLGARGWEPASLGPPFEPLPANGNEDLEFEKLDQDWDQTFVMVSTGGDIWTVSGTTLSPGTRTTARRVGGKTERLGREISSLNPNRSVVTADGTLWNITFTKLERFEKGRWKPVADLPKVAGPSRLAPLNANGPPWLLLDRVDHRLWRLDHGPRGENAQVAKPIVRDGEKALEIYGAVSSSDGTLLLATDAGLRTYVPATGTTSRTDFPEPPQPPTALVRDRLGRLWLGNGKGLWLSERGAKSVDAFSNVPWVGRGEVRALAPDPERADGVIVAVESRGVASVRAGPRP